MSGSSFVVGWFMDDESCGPLLVIDLRLVVP